MAEKRVIEYEAASELANDDWLLIDGVTEGTRKARPSTVTAELGAQVTNLASTVGGLTQVAMGHEQSFAPSYDEDTSYDVGDLVMQYHCLYRCTAATTGTWDAGKWERTEVSEQLEESGKIDDVQVNGVSVVTDKVASIDLTGMQDDIDSKQADTKIGGASILDENKVLNMDNFVPKASIPSGAISTFGNATALPMPSLTVGIEPVQDLHGYDSPWAGGGGKNLLDVKNKVPSAVISGVTYVSDDNYIILDGTKSGGGYADLSSLSITLDVGTYYLKAIVISGTTSGGVEIYPYDGTNNITGTILNIERKLTFSESKTFRFRFAVWTDGTVLTNYKIGIVVSKTANIDKFYPYSNICPISGFSAVNRYRTGINMWDEEWRIDQGQFKALNLIPVIPNTTFYFKCPVNVASAFKYDINRNLLGPMGITKDAVFTTDSKTYYIWYSLFENDYGTTYNNDISINYPSTDTDYHAYNGTIYTTALKDSQDNPLTCYGGELSNENGVQTLTNGKDIRLVSECTWQGSNGAFYTNSVSSSIKHGDGRFDHVMSSAYKTENVGSITPLSDGAISVDTDGYIQIKDSRYSTAGDFKSNMGTTQLIYELATPQTIPQDNLAIASQDGTNNLWADSGDVLSGQYFTNSVPSNVYSTEEKAVGVDVDGKTRYQKTYLNLGNVTSYTFSDLTNVSTMFVVSEGSKLNGGLPFPYIHPDSDNVVGYFFDLSGTNPKIEIRKGSGSSSATLDMLTIQYTK